MSKERKTGSKRQTILKNFGCRYCGNDKMHNDGMTKWCTKCKRRHTN